ncbi:MAG: hypothetical protein GXO32_04710 [Crenarchaeota archaeon]|nr:hypothetical protein [Thermoproteota archaeon]
MAQSTPQTLDLSPLSSRKYIVVSDTDGHGIALAAAYLRSLINAGVPEEDIAVVQHFTVKPDEPATTARGDVAKMLEMIADAMPEGARVIMTDIPVPEGREEPFVRALVKLAEKAGDVLVIDHIDHSKVYARLLETLPQDLRTKLIELTRSKKLTIEWEDNAMAMFTRAIVTTPFDTELFDLAVLGAIMDSDYASLLSTGQALANVVIEALKARGVDPETLTRIKPPTIDEIRSRYHYIVALDSYIKFGMKPDVLSKVQTDVVAIGNTAFKSVYLAKVGVSKLTEEAMQVSKVPSPEEVMKDTEVLDNVAVYKKIAPPGQGFKYASLIDAATDVPVIIVPATVGKGVRVLIVAPESFDLATSPKAKSMLVALKDKIFRWLVEKGYSDPQRDVPRGAAAYSIGLSKVQSDEDHIRAAVELAQHLDKMVRQEDIEAALKKMVKSELEGFIPEPAFRALVAKMVADAVNVATTKIARDVSRLEERLEKLEKAFEAIAKHLGAREPATA